MAEIVGADIQLGDVINTLRDNNGDCDRVQRDHENATSMGKLAIDKLDKVDAEAATGVINDVQAGYEASEVLIETLRGNIDAVKTANSGVRSVQSYFSSAKLYGDKLRVPLRRANTAMVAWRLSAEETLHSSSGAARSAELAGRQLQGYGSGNDLSNSTTGELVQGVISKARNYRDEVASRAANTVREGDIKLTGAVNEFWKNINRVERDASGLPSIQHRMEHAQQLLESCLADLEAMNNPELISARLSKLSASQQEIVAVKANAADTLTFLYEKSELSGEIAGLSQAAKSAAEEARENL